MHIEFRKNIRRCPWCGSKLTERLGGPFNRSWFRQYGCAKCGQLFKGIKLQLRKLELRMSFR